MEEKIDFSSGYKIRNQKGIFYLTLQIVYWIDLFTRERYKEILVESLVYCQENKGLKVYAWVIMSNHVHLIVSSVATPLSDIIRDLKSFTSKEFIKVMETSEESRKWMAALFRHAAGKHKRNKSYQIWTHENHPVELETNYFMDQKLQYIHENPVKAGIVSRAEDYLYSSAGAYSGNPSRIKIYFLE